MRQKAVGISIGKRIFIFVLIGILLSTGVEKVSAKPSKVRIAVFHFELAGNQTDFSLDRQFTTTGYYPDYKFQPELGYSLKILDSADNELFSVKFLSPLRIYSHQYAEDEITGGLTILGKTDFALTLPTFSSEMSIVIVDENNNPIFSAGIPQEKNDRPLGVILLIISIIVIFAIFLTARKMRKKNPAR